jgi:hypothetical protein
LNGRRDALALHVLNALADTLNPASAIDRTLAGMALVAITVSTGKSRPNEASEG